MKKQLFSVKSIALCAVLTATYLGLAMFSFIIGGVKVTIEGLPVIIAATLLGPAPAAIVGFLGEFMNQMLTYGFTPTTLLWVLPAVARGLFAGFCLKAVSKSGRFPGWRTAALFVICALSGVLASCFNTLAYYVDSKMLGYYNYALVLGAFWIRVGVGAAASSVMAAVTIPVTIALQRAKLID